MKTCPLCETVYPNQQTNCPTDGARLIESRDFEPGTVVRGKYRIVRLLGRGGMGTVYLAEHILLGRPRALKFIASELAQDATFLRRFRREAQAAIELRHPNIVEVGDLDQAEDGSPYIAMEYVEGQDLRQALTALSGENERHPERSADPHECHLERSADPNDCHPERSADPNDCHPERSADPNDCHPERSAAESKDLRLPFGAFPVERALAIARGIALGLGAAHAKGIVHRDVKPENILLSISKGGAETPKLLDFGIAAMKESATAISRTRGLMLTPEYAAPEQWKGMAAEELDGRTDLYALGGVLHEMLTGSTSFHSHNTEGWMYQHLMAEPAAPSSLRPELANWPGLDDLVMRLLAKDRDKRPRDVGELLHLLEAVHYVAPIARRETVKEEPPPVNRRETVRDDVNPSPTPQPAPKRKPKPVTAHAPISLDSEPSTAPAPSRTNPIKWLVAAALPILAVAGIWFVTRPSTWTDPATGLTWAKKDNGSDVNWQQATDYCWNLQLADRGDWRLPKSDELEGIYDGNVKVSGWYHAKGNLQLSGVWHWSSSRENANGGAFIFTFMNSFKTPYRLDQSVGGRALCVRGLSRQGPASLVNPAHVAPSPNPAPDKQIPKANPKDVWTDPATGLMWTKKDSEVGYRYDHGVMSDKDMASAYCRNLRLDGFSDWTLPSIVELAGLYDSTQTRNIVGDSAITYHMKGGIILSIMIVWSKPSVDAGAEVSGFDFRSGRKSADPYGDSEGGSTAICVRHPGR